MMGQSLLIDGDDTLWENNIYFERAIADFITFLDHATLSHDEVRAVLDEIEAEQGYGSTNFTASLRMVYSRLAERDVRSEDHDYLSGLGQRVAEHPLEVMPGVVETLNYLAGRHELFLVTKGAEEEQRLKIDASGLAAYFSHTVVVPEKDASTYAALVQRFQLEVGQTWMIGNSPRSDVNPALEAGLHAVYIPHPHTWRLEQHDLRAATEGRLLTLECFADLRRHF
jgi:putative hydrolase of the HAD superfamily